MTEIDKERLDEHITGNQGEDQNKCMDCGTQCEQDENGDLYCPLCDLSHQTETEDGPVL